MHKEEIHSAELSRYGSELLDALEDVCKSSPFRTSPKSCEFLRHVVDQTLRGNADELKERLIGIALLGRETTYDTGSDAGVRVRANDVRKRLTAYSSSNGDHAEFTFDLPAGSYVPRFFRRVASIPASIPSVAQQPSVPSSLEQSPPLSLQQVALPTLIALFLCTICIRWQLTQEHPFTTFWQTVLQDHHALLYVAPSQSSDQRELISMEGLEVAAPLINLAGQFHAQLKLTRTLTPPMSTEDILVSVGPSDQGRNRLVMENTPTGKEIIDLRAATPHPLIPGRAALLTIANGPSRTIHLDGTDDEAIRSMVQTLCERNSFPEDLTDSFQSGTITQVVFPMTAHTAAIVFHEPLQATQSASVDFR
jgi:hypothetical protein